MATAPSGGDVRSRGLDTLNPVDGGEGDVDSLVPRAVLDWIRAAKEPRERQAEENLASKIDFLSRSVDYADEMFRGPQFQDGSSNPDKEVEEKKRGTNDKIRLVGRSAPWLVPDASNLDTRDEDDDDVFPEENVGTILDFGQFCYLVECTSAVNLIVTSSNQTGL